MTPEILIDHPEGGIAILRLNATGRKNALTGSMALALIEACKQLDADPNVGAVVITGGADAFCAGAHRDLLTAAGTREDSNATSDLESIYQAFSTVRALEVPTIASICGPAVGAGLNLALACDVRIVGRNAYLRSMFVANDIHPAGGHLRMLLEIGGPSLAVRLAVFDQPLDAEAAVASGLAIGPVAPEDAERQAARLARHAGAKPRLARWIRRSLARSTDLAVDDAATLEAEAQLLSLRKFHEEP
ncbi:MAG: enoyl-CoA hydratase-related protein [Actinomycetota bacterium]|nr:enoyl-CoA hydratase-related protein [Actinomycetota bacterium]